MTLNIAHGRKDGRHQALLGRRTIESNLDDIAGVLRHVRPDVVALQEADGPSLWSGRFDHVDYLAEAGGFPYSLRGEHMQGLRLSYGTALISKHAVSDPASYAFRPSPPTFTKGFVVATIHWPGRPELMVDVVSVHLDFARASVRRRQTEEIIQQLSDRGHRRIVMGDFNCRWRGRERTLRDLAEQLDLIAYCPDDAGLCTFPKLRRRLDWILISKQFEFASHAILADSLSDHRAVLAEIGLAPSPQD